MKKIIFVLLLLMISGGVGWFCVPQKNPYQVDYNKIVINLPIIPTKILADKTFPYGEKYLGEDMAKELEAQGFDVKLYSFEDTYSNLNFKQGIDIYLRHYPELSLPKYHKSFDRDKIGILFETVPYALTQVANADIVFTGSLKKYKEYKNLGINAHFLPQFTRTDKFYPAYKPEYQTNVLFIGNQWREFDLRKSVRYASEMGVEVDIYGDSLLKRMDEDKKYMWKGLQIPGDELKYYYSSANIVLNDTRPDMIANGSLNNRIFDVTACKGFIITDYMKEIEEIYGDAIPMYKTKEEFKALIDYYLAHPEERRAKAEKAYQITTSRFSAKATIKKMVDVIRDYQMQHHLGE